MVRFQIKMAILAWLLTAVLAGASEPPGRYLRLAYANNARNPNTPAPGSLRPPSPNGPAGTIQSASAPTRRSAKFYEHQKYLTIARHAYTPLSLLMSKRTWEKLSHEEKKIVTNAAVDARDFERMLSRENSAQALAKELFSEIAGFRSGAR